MVEEQGGGETLSVFEAHREEPSGQDAASPPAVDELEGQGPDDTPAGKEGASGEETPTSKEKESSKPEKKEKPPPYDQDPKWKAARAAEARLDKMAQKYGFEDHDGLFEAFEEAHDLKDVLGKRDLTQLIRDSRRLTDFESQHGDLGDIVERLQNQSDDLYDEDDEETRALKKENIALKRRQEVEEWQRHETDRKNKAVKNYSEDVQGIIDGAEFPKEQKEIVSLMHGLQNPAMEVDITDRVAVKRMARSLTKKAQKIIGTIKQNAIDEYAAGKSGLVPKKEGASPPKTSTKAEEPKPRRALKSADVDKAFDKMGAKFLEEAEEPCFKLLSPES